jgi:coproporphyrinogen III oxidase
LHTAALPVAGRRHFYIPVRQEHRGIGGLFFDDLSPAEVSFDVEAFVRVGGHSTPAAGLL